MEIERAMVPCVEIERAAAPYIEIERAVVVEEVEEKS